MGWITDNPFSWRRLLFPSDWLTTCCPSRCIVPYSAGYVAFVSNAGLLLTAIPNGSRTSYLKASMRTNHFLRLCFYAFYDDILSVCLTSIYGAAPQSQIPSSLEVIYFHLYTVPQYPFAQLTHGRYFTCYIPKQFLFHLLQTSQLAP